MPSLSAQKAVLGMCLAMCLLAGCANPGPPKPPSLGIPAVVSDLSAVRRGNAVDLHFTLPQRTTDGTMLRPGAMTARLCRAVDTGICQPLGTPANTFAVPIGPKTPANLQDVLPADLTIGRPRLLTYRVELRNQRGRSGGFSDAAYSAAGEAPPPVTALQARGSRLGVVLSWQRSTDLVSEVLLERTDLNFRPGEHAPKSPPQTKTSGTAKFSAALSGKGKPKSATVLLNAAGDANAAMRNANPDTTLDTTAEADTQYRYAAERREIVQLAGHKIELWSEPSTPDMFTLHDTFPPPVPTDLTVAGFPETNAKGDTTGYAADLIWEPVQDEELAGYKVYRQTLGVNGTGEKVLLTPTPVRLPAFHDATVSGSNLYRYSVTSIDLKGNESGAAVAVLEPLAK